MGDIMSRGIPLRNIVYERIMQHKTITDSELLNLLEKDGVEITEARLNKTLLDLEILGFIRVGWITKDKRRIEYRERREGEEKESMNNSTV